MFKNKVLLLLLLLSVSFGSPAQVKKRQARAKASEIKVEKHVDPSDLLYENMLSSTARVLFIDSIVTDKADFLNKIPLNKESGRIGLYDELYGTSGNPSSFVYINEFGNKMFFSLPGQDGQCRLYSADKLNGQWTNQKLIDDFGEDFEDINYPFMMSDGVTLYFSAKSKEGLGGYDIYVTMYDADSARFYKPENIGLPYNSKANDYYCVIDEFDEIGWLVTDRNQPEGKVCVYTFVPSSSREVYDENEVGEERLKSLAGIWSIKDTWTDEQQLVSAKGRLAKLFRRRGDGGDVDIRFIVNDNTVYTKLEDFKSATDRDRFIKLSMKKQACQGITEKLDGYRKEYSSGTMAVKRRLVATIKDLEEKHGQLYREIRSLEKDIRNSENLLNLKR